VDGTDWVIFTVGTVDSPGAYDDDTIAAVSLKSGERRDLVQGASTARYASTGHLVFSRHGVLFAVRLDPIQMKTVGRPVPVLDSVAGETTSGAVHFDVAQDGTLVYVSGQPEGLDQELVWVDRNGQVEVVAAPPRPYQQPHVSPDGKQVLVGIGPGLGKCDTWRLDLERGTLSRLTFDGRSVDAFWLPDQRRMVLGIEAPDQMLVLTLDGSLPPRVVYESSTPYTISGLTPDGQSVLLSEYGAADSDVLLIPLEGDGHPQALITERGQQFGAVVSPDGRWIAYRSSEGGPGEVYVRHFQGGSGKWQVSQGGGEAPLWSPDGTELYFVNGVTMMSVSVTFDDTGLSTATPKKLFELPSGRRYEATYRPYDISPDGKRFLFTRTAQPGLERRQINVVLNWSAELKAKAPAPN
jgi:dipeptidyl aminopeptidase/acylaminoacyl peptidase